MRGVITSNAFGPELPRLQILSISGTWIVPAKADASHMVLAQVAGLDEAILGLPQTTMPVLFELPESDAHGNVLVSTTKLSQFVSGRYGPASKWQSVWSMVFGWLLPESKIDALRWTPVVRPSHQRDEPLSEASMRSAVFRGADHYIHSRFLVHRSWRDRLDQWGAHDERVAQAPTSDMPIGDGTLGLLEAFNATIDHNGYQPARWYLRADCNAEAGMALAIRGAIGNDEHSRKIATNLQDFVYFHSRIQGGPRADPNNPGFGLLGWDTRSVGENIYYADDNARALLGTLAAAAALKSDRWDENVLRSILGNFRTTGKRGFRNASLSQHDLEARGWKHYYNGSTVHIAPHFEAYPWACYLWLYHKTGFTPLLTRTKKAIRTTMEAYPSGWRWTNGMQQERARMLLPLAWLVRVEDTPEHREWLDRIVKGIQKNQVEVGAIRDEMGEAGKGLFEGPKSNEAYGTSEAPLIQQNGDPICDLLYTTNFALLGLNEAAAATGNPEYERSVAKLAEFLCRIQVKSEKHPALDGAWFRAFNYDRWDYWASNSDGGWGAWSTETGWTQGWIAGVLGMRVMKTSLWDLTADSKIAVHMDRVQSQMLPDSAFVQPLVEHVAKGQTVTLASKFAEQYSADGTAGLVDGIAADANDLDANWQGYHGVDLDATITFHDPIAVSDVSCSFLQVVSAGVFLPASFEVFTSEDGVKFAKLGSATHEISARTEGPMSTALSVKGDGQVAKSVRILAKNIGKIPAWHSAAPGQPAWLFVDEIVVNPAAMTGDANADSKP
jgi:hypothetical protein